MVRSKLRFKVVYQIPASMAKSALLLIACSHIHLKVKKHRGMLRRIARKSVRWTMVCLWCQTIAYIFRHDVPTVVQFGTGFAEFEHVGFGNPFWGPLLDSCILSTTNTYSMPNVVQKWATFGNSDTESELFRLNIYGHWTCHTTTP